MGDAPGKMPLCENQQPTMGILRVGRLGSMTTGEVKKNAWAFVSPHMGIVYVCMDGYGICLDGYGRCMDGYGICMDGYVRCMSD